MIRTTHQDDFDDITIPSRMLDNDIFHEGELDSCSSDFPEEHLTLKRANPIHDIDDDDEIIMPLLKRARPTTYEYWDQ